MLRVGSKRTLFHFDNKLAVASEKIPFWERLREDY